MRSILTRSKALALFASTCLFLLLTGAECDPDRIVTVAGCTAIDDVGDSAIVTLHASSCASCRTELLVSAGNAEFSTESGEPLEPVDGVYHNPPSRVRMTALSAGMLHVSYTLIEPNGTQHSGDCSTFVRAPDPPPDAGFDAGVVDAGSDAGLDASTEVDAGAFECTTRTMSPTRGFSVDAVDGPANTIPGPWCGDPGGIRERGVGFIGLSRRPGDIGIDLEPADAVDRVVSSCVGADFGAAYDFTQIRVVAAAQDDVCGDGCIPAEGGCHTGRTVAAYGSLDGDNFTYISGADEVPDRRFGMRSIVRDGRAQYILLCRGGWGAARDNLEIDYVELCVAP